jgi:subtilisin family serine protease
VLKPIKFKLIFTIVFLFFISITPQVIHSINLEAPNVQKILVEPDESKIFTTISIGNKTYIYDVELARNLKEAGIEFSLQDLVDYSNVTEISLLVKYKKITHTGASSLLAFVTDATGIPLTETDKTTVNQISSSASSVGGKLVDKYETIPYVSVDPPVNKLKEFVSKLPSKIEKVYVDSKVNVLLDKSVPIIKNPAKQTIIEQTYGKLDGSGMKIAILDTGIDKTHPDIDDLDDDSNTNDPKIIAEKSFVGDNDPSDRFGHGTHCASIASGTGQASNYKYVGVAPKAKLLNGKVLDDYGSGMYSDIISGIEWAVNNDADVISMSLGGPGTNEPLEDAVKMAIERGVVVVAAAGNSGEGGWQTIDMPGVVKEVITVGASNSSDLIAAFSSRGPTNDLLVKPDVVAPGVKICAANVAGGYIDVNFQDRKTCGNDKYISLSGTSMATPHVAGAVALIKQAHPAWTPDMIKSALMLTSKDLGLSSYDQGSGRIDVYNTVDAQLIVTPQTVNFGLLSSSFLSSSIEIKNIRSVPYGIHISAEKVKNVIHENSYDAISQFSDNDFCLNPNDQKDISFHLNATLLSTGYYSGYLRIDVFDNCEFDSASKRLNIPLGFSKLKNVTVNYITPQIFAPDELKFHDTIFVYGPGKIEFKSIYSQETSETFFATEEEFDVLVVFMAENKYGISEYGPLYGDKWKLSHIVKKADLKNKNSISLTFDESIGRKIQTNVNDIFASRNMKNYFVESIFGLGKSYQSFGHGSFDTSDYPIIKEWYVTVNADDSLYSTNYGIRLSVSGKKYGESFASSSEFMIIPMIFYYPFTNLQASIPQSQLRMIDVNFYDSFKDTNVLDFGINSYIPEQNFIYIPASFLNYPPTEKKIYVRDNQYCPNCNYLFYVGYENFTAGFPDMPFFEALFYNGGNYPGLTSLPQKINVMEKPFTLNITTDYDILPKGLLFKLYDKYGKIVNFATRKDILKVTKPDGTTVSSQGPHWKIDCSSSDIGTCQVGDYVILWKVYDVIKDQNVSIKTRANWNGNKWTVLENIELGCDIPDSTECSVSSMCSCSVNNCNSGWIRARLPDEREFVKYFTDGKASFNSGSTKGTTTVYISCLDDAKEYSYSFSVV